MPGLPVLRLEVPGLTRISYPGQLLLVPAVPCQTLKRGVISEVPSWVGTLGVFGSPNCLGFPGPVFKSPNGLQLTQELPRLGRLGPRVGEGPFTNSHDICCFRHLHIGVSPCLCERPALSFLPVPKEVGDQGPACKPSLPLDSLLSLFFLEH